MLSKKQCANPHLKLWIYDRHLFLGPQEFLILDGAQEH